MFCWKICLVHNFWLIVFGAITAYITIDKYTHYSHSYIIKEEKKKTREESYGLTITAYSHHFING